MVVFERALLTGLHRIAVINTCAASTVLTEFKGVSESELTATVGNEDFDIFIEEFRAEDILKKIYAINHTLAGFNILEDSEEEWNGYELKCLDVRPIGDIVVNGIHLDN